MLVEETTSTDFAAEPTKVTEVAPVNLEPLIVTGCQVIALAGEKELMLGGAKKVNPTLVAVPPGVVTLTLPDAPAVTTRADILVGETTVNEEAAMPPKLTAVAPVKSEPVIVTAITPTTSVSGKKDMIAGGSCVGSAMEKP